VGFFMTLKTIIQSSWREVSSLTWAIDIYNTVTRSVIRAM
jgi:hypothetical protein